MPVSGTDGASWNRSLEALSKGVNHVYQGLGKRVRSRAITPFERDRLIARLQPTLNVEEPNPELGLAGTPFYLNTETRPWTHGGQGTPGAQAMAGQRNWPHSQSVRALQSFSANGSWA